MLEKSPHLVLDIIRKCHNGAIYPQIAKEMIDLYDKGIWQMPDGFREEVKSRKEVERLLAANVSQILNSLYRKGLVKKERNEEKNRNVYTVI
jgi:hypothetical protein